ncbi:MAG TPA: DUF4167 domain-containing protein [Sphingomicrobium sp.]
MINNRQGGRRRGRGGQRGQNLGGQPGNRQDNRQRGNAAQLLEKYKSMARDAQLAGDRVQTEYYLQFADHYFRVLSENRARFEDQNPRRGRDDEMDEDEGDEEMADAVESEDSESDDREARRDRQERGPRRPRGDRDQRRFDRDDRAARHDEDSSDGARHVNGGGDSLPLEVLPPAIGADDSASEETAAPRPRRRTRATRPADGDEEIAPAA